VSDVPGSTPQGATASEVALSVDHLFRRHAGQMIATLTRILGVRNLDLAEDAVQDALVKALHQWPYHGVPDNPAAWIVQVAKNRALDRLRRRSTWGRKQDVVVRELERLPRTALDEVTFPTELRDDQLQMIFVCCHPAISRDAQVALTLKLVGGFGVSELARAFLTRPGTMAQRLVRAKKALRTQAVTFEMPEGEALTRRLDPVLEVLYLMFNEGYGAAEGDALVRHDLCREAIRLTLEVCDHPLVGSPKADALAALLLFQGGRLATRADSAGDLLLMAEQNRSLWDREMLRQGVLLLARAGRGDALSTYHLEAEIAACHALARDYESTDWHRILQCYDALRRRNPSPVVAINRLVALAQVEGSEKALSQCVTLLAAPALESYYPAHAIHGELLAGAGDSSAAQAAFARAMELTASAPVRRFLERRAAQLRSAATS
jgi:RNA polymerase sigma-70 factor (ECF subfamily)